MPSQKEIEHVRNKYKDRMLMLAFIAAGWSQEPEGRRHGCVLAYMGKYVVAIGFNGPDRYAEAVQDPFTKIWKLPRLVHAEENALINARKIGVDISMCIAFQTKKPCKPCHELLNAAGVQAIFWLQDCSGRAAYWVQGEEMNGYGEFSEEKSDNVPNSVEVDRA